MRKVIIDFETYYCKKEGISTAEVGNVNYTKQTEAYCLAIKDGDQKTYVGTIDNNGIPDRKLDTLCSKLSADKDVEIWAANSNFDRAWWSKYWGPTVNDWKCALDQGAVNQYPRFLAGLSQAVLGIAPDKTIRAAMDGVDFWDMDKDAQQNVLDYCATDVDVTAGVIEKMPEMSAHEDKVAAYTRMSNRRGVRVDTTELDRGIEFMHQANFEYKQLIPWIDDAAPLSPQALARFCQSHKMPFPKSVDKRDAECTALMAKYPLLNQTINAMRVVRGTNAKGKKLQDVRKRLIDGDIMQTSLLYCGAPHTRRWSCVDINMQNLDAAPMELETNDSFWVREIFVPRPGKKYLIIDLAQIEPRCLAWLTGNDDMLKLVREGYSVYEAYARASGAWKGTEKLADANKPLYKKIKAQVLGLGYGMGVERFCAETPGVEIDEAGAMVKQFRSLNPGITTMWKDFDKMIRAAVFDKSFKVEIEMPSGEMLSHHSVKQERKGFSSYTIQGMRSQRHKQSGLWGGVLTENVTQRMARDVLSHSILRLEESGFPVLWTAHDEAIIEVDADAGQDTMDEAVEIFTTAPDWCPDLPLGAEGFYETTYTKI